MNAPYPPPSRALDMSPVSVGSEWSGMNNYNASASRSEVAYAGYNNDPISPPDSASNLPSQYGRDGMRPPPMEGQRRPSESGSRNSSRAASIANSRSSDGTISDVQSRKYRRMEMELQQHYAVLKAYLRGNSQHPPRTNKARDKLLRLSPIQFHELSTDVFDELQRRQASAPLPGRTPRRNEVPPYLQSRPDFHEKRNQARQKLSSLATSRFRDLSTDVFCELERRFPHLNRDGGSRPASRGGPGRPGPNGFPPPPRNHSAGLSVSSTRSGSAPGPENGSNGDFARPMQRQFQSSTFTPNKSTMVEDEDEMAGVDSRYDRSSDAFGLESALTSPRSDRDTSATSQSIGSGMGKAGPLSMAGLQDELNELREQLKAKDEQLQRMSTTAEDRETKQMLETKLANVEELNRSMKEEFDDLQQEHANMERNLRAELESVKQTSAKTRPNGEVQRENDELYQRLKQQEEIIQDVRRQGQLYLEEMRAMADSGGGDFEREDKLQADVHRLEEELKEWKAKYVRAKTQLRSVRASSLGLSISRLDVGQAARDGSLYEATGAVRDVHITKFQIAIDELLRIARSDPAGVLDHMKTVVMAVRNITSDIENATPIAKGEELVKKRSKLKSKVSATANNVITASKNYAAAGGLSPVSLLDAAASHLTAAVVDLVRTVKIRPTPPGELEDNDDGSLAPVQPNGYFNIAESLRRRSNVDSVYSAISTPDAGQGQSGPGPSVHRRSNSNYTNGNGLDGLRNGLGITAGLGLGQEYGHLEDLKVYIEDQTEQLVEAIQILIEAVRRDEPMFNIRNNIARIVSTIDAVVASAAKGSNEPTSYQSEFRNQTLSLQDNLEACKKKLLQAAEESHAYENQPSTKDLTQKLPPLAFQVARETRELVRRVQGIRVGGEEDFN